MLPIINPEIDSDDGLFHDGNPTLGVLGTPCQSGWLNPMTAATLSLQAEVISVLATAGIDVDATKNTQLRDAIASILQGAAGTYAVDIGVANACVVKYEPKATALTDGMRRAFRAKAANSGATTLAIDDLPVKDIWGSAHAPLQGGEIVADGYVLVEWNAAINGGNGVWVLVESTGGAQQVPNATAPKHAVALGQLQSSLLGASSIPSISIATTLTSSAAGKSHVFTAGVAATLPAASSLLSGQSISFQSLAAGASVVRAGSDVITTGNGTPTSVGLNAGDTLTVRSNGTNGWYAVAGSAQLQYASIMRSLTSLGTGTGYRQFPAYPGDPTPLLVQWGSTVSPAAANTEATTTLQTSFPIECSDVLLTDYATLSNVGVIWTVSAKNQGNFKAYWGAGSVSPGSTNARSAMYVAIGR